MACCAVLLYKRHRGIMRGEGRSCHHIHYGNGGTNCTSSISINRLSRSWLLLLVKMRRRLPLGMKRIRKHKNCAALIFVFRLFWACTNWDDMYLKLCFFFLKKNRVFISWVQQLILLPGALAAWVGAKQRAQREKRHEKRSGRRGVWPHPVSLCGNVSHGKRWSDSLNIALHMLCQTPFAHEDGGCDGELIPFRQKKN